MKKLFTFIAVAAMAFAAQADVLTVCDGGDTNTSVPIYGLYADVNGTIGQMIYTPALLDGLEGGKISQVKFYTSGINFSGVTLQLSMKDLETRDNFSDYVYFTDLMEVAQTTPSEGDTELVFNLSQPYTYEGGNLVLEVKVIATEGDWGTTTFYGMNTEYAASYYHYWYSWSDTPSKWTANFLPKVTFDYEIGGVTPPVEPTVKTGAPTFHGYTEDGIHAYFVEITPTEPSVIYYRVQYPDGTWTEWAEYEEILSFTGDGKYRVEAYAIADGKLKSEDIAYEFVVAPLTGIEEMNADKQVAGVRYFNMAGQEMQQAEGLTIVVTTYIDGTTSAVKVVK